MLTKAWNPQNSHALLWGCKMRKTTLENSLAVSCKTKHSPTLQYRNSTYVHKKICLYQLYL